MKVAVLSGVFWLLGFVFGVTIMQPEPPVFDVGLQIVEPCKEHGEDVHTVVDVRSSYEYLVTDGMQESWVTADDINFVIAAIEAAYGTTATRNQP